MALRENSNVADVMGCVELTEYSYMNLCAVGRPLSPVLPLWPALSLPPGWLQRPNPKSYIVQPSESIQVVVARSIEWTVVSIVTTTSTPDATCMLDTYTVHTV